MFLEEAKSLFIDGVWGCKGLKSHGLPRRLATTQLHNCVLRECVQFEESVAVLHMEASSVKGGTMIHLVYTLQYPNNVMSWLSQQNIRIELSKSNLC